MTGSTAREELEAVIHRELAAACRRGRESVTVTITGPFAFEVILAAADRYAAERATEELDRYDGRARLEEAAAETPPRSGQWRRGPARRRPA